MTKPSTYSFHIFLAIALLLSSCGITEDDPHLKGPVFFGTRPPDGLSEQELACIQFNELAHEDSSLVSATQLYDSSSLFRSLILELEVTDPPMFRDIAEDGTIDFCLFLPTNHAVRAFEQKYPNILKTETGIIKLVRAHIMDEKFDYVGMASSNPRAPDMNGRPVDFEKSSEACVLINGQGKPFLVDGVCNNGIIHVIDRVLFPPEGF